MRTVERHIQILCFGSCRGWPERRKGDIAALGSRQIALLTCLNDQVADPAGSLGAELVERTAYRPVRQSSKLRVEDVLVRPDRRRTSPRCTRCACARTAGVEVSGGCLPEKSGSPTSVEGTR